MQNIYRKLILFATCLTFGIVVLGAFVRLSDAGLGCPDWPGCYGHIGVPEAAHDVAQAEQAFPGKPVEARKGWIEMAHRYFASSLGLLILIIAFLAYKNRQQFQQTIGLPIALAGVVIFQGLLGMWTVTLLLKPAIVTAHLIGGMTLLALLTWFMLRQYEQAGKPRIIVAESLTWHARIALIVLTCQIILGGWVSTNYAALACVDFPTCNKSMVPQMDFANAFHLLRDLGMTAQGAALSHEALTAIHWSHRLGALIVTLVLASLALRMLKVNELKKAARMLLAVLVLQISLGITIVLTSLPLPLAVMHSAFAALLLVTMVIINFRMAPETRSTRLANA
ncbi:MAG: COX15/CtaA family protein [Burkholderiales bacterium]